MLFFFIVSFGFFLWMLFFGKGIMKCYWYKSCDYFSFVNKIKLCIEEFYSFFKESYNCDYRVLLDGVMLGKFSELFDEEKSKKFCYLCDFFYFFKLIFF